MDARKRRLALLSGLWILAFLVLWFFRSSVLPFAGAALVAYIIAPAIDRLSRVGFRKHRLPRWGALLFVYGVFFLGAYTFLVALLPQLYREMTRISGELLQRAQSLTPERTQQIAMDMEAWLNQRGLPVALSEHTLDTPGGFSLSLDLERLIREVATRASALVQDNLGNIVQTSRRLLGGIIAGIFMTFFILMVAAFFSIDSVRIRQYVRGLLPSEYAEDVRKLIANIDRSLAGVVRGQLTICLVNGALTLAGLLLFKVKFAFLLATIATAFSLVPIFGTIISSVPIVLVALADGWKSGFAMLGWILGIHALEAYFLNPKIMGEAARIHPVVVAFALLAGERTYGIVGALLAVPLAAIFVACFEFLREKAQPSVQLIAASSTPEPASTPPG